MSCSGVIHRVREPTRPTELSEFVAWVERMNAEINKILKTPEMAKRMEGMNFEPPPVKSVDEFKTIVARDLKTWQSITSDAGIELD